jgi:hypothetical protein
MRTERKIAVRSFINDRFNTTYGKGLFRRAIFNGTIELRNPQCKFLIDIYQYPEWEAMAKNDDQIDIIRKLEDTEMPKAKELAFSWIVHYDPLTKVKTPVKGFVVYAQDSNELYVNIDSPEFNTVEEWTLKAHACKATGTNKPAVIATNVDLVAW